MREYTEKLLEKLRESTAAVLPIAGIVLVLCFALVPVPSGILLCFLAGAVLLTVGMMFFNLGAEMAMSPIGERVGPAMTKSRKLWVVLVLAFLLGVIITVSEPDLQVLAELVPSVPNEVLILFVAAGVGVFLDFANALWYRPSGDAGGLLRPGLFSGLSGAGGLPVGGF